jgi:transcriptional regulator with XRE-family HTH domain
LTSYPERSRATPVRPLVSRLEDRYAPRIVGPDPHAARNLREALGEVLRDARRRRGLTLREASAASGDRFRPSAIGGYERGERSISVERFCELAILYGVPADRMLAEALERLTPLGRAEIVIDLTQLELLPGEEPRLAAELVERVRQERGGEVGNLVSLRAADLQALAAASRLDPRDLITRLERAIRVSSSEPS